jgi:nascent polypeptide-associated complex subunit alpha
MFKQDPKKLQDIMKKLNMNTRELEASKVIIKAKNREISILKPNIIVVTMMGKDVYQITGDVDEKMNVSENDVRLVMDKTGKDRETVVAKLEEMDNDLAKAIMELKETGKKRK